jgi:DNA-binding CsgD family transcriptional regulator
MMARAKRHARPIVLAVAIAVLALLLAEEISQSDAKTWLELVTDLLELALFIGSGATCTLLLFRTRAQQEESLLLRRDVEQIRAQSERWREDMAVHLKELGTAIQRQFQAWGLTPAEQDIGLLLLKGFSHKEIARLRNASEATIRQQAASVYRKANLNGRAALSAYFLEELLLPGEPPNGRAAIQGVASRQTV